MATIRARCDPTGTSVDVAWLAALATLLSRYGSAQRARFCLREGARERTLSISLDGVASFAELSRRARAELEQGDDSGDEGSDASPATVQLALAMAATSELRAPLELSLRVRCQAEAITLHAEYHSGLFSDAFIARLLAHLERLLDEGTRAPASLPAALPMISDEERRFLLQEVNATEEEHERELCLHHLVERVARVRPGDIAALFPQPSGEVLTLSYRDLDERANRLADLLYRKGVARDEVVGVYARRTPELLCALLGVLKAGAAYLPLDPAFPAARLARMSEDAALRFLVSERLLERSAPTGPALLVLEDALANQTLRSGEPPLVEHDPEQLAYVLFTSGSSGRPKGVPVPHRAVVNLLASMARRPGFTREDRLLALTTLSFDISVLELFLPLVSGASVVVASREDALKPARVAHLLEAHDVSVMQATPATWRALIDDGWRGARSATSGRRAHGLKALCGGETLPAELASALLERGAELWNLYGPTETTVWSTRERVLPGEPISVGRPIGNTRVYVLDEQRNPQPIGVKGALWIGGAGVARDYLRPAFNAAPSAAVASAERFVPDPFASEDGARMYRTGDVARVREDGKIELLGRDDQQVKVRGFRVEPAEIEAALEREQDIAQAVVVAREGSRGLQQLVAYLRLNSTAGVAVDDEALKRGLARRLPDYMIPSAFIALASFPLTPSGKLDRARLSDPGLLRRAPDALQGAPGSEDERRVLQLFEEVLRMWPLGSDEDFFTLGGDLRLAEQLCARVHEELCLQLSADDLLEAPTASTLTRHLREREPGAGWRVGVQPGDERPPVFCVAGIGGHAMMFRALAARSDEHRRFVGLRWPGDDDGVSAAPADIVALAKFLVSKLEQSYPSDMPVYLAAYAASGLVAYEMAVELAARGRAPALLALLDTPGPARSRASEKMSRLTTHLHNLAKRSTTDKARYALRWAQVAVPRLLRRSEGYYELMEDRGTASRQLRAVRRAHVRALERYQPRAYAGRATLIRALSLPFGIERRSDPHLGWRELFGDRLELVELRAPHGQLLHDPYLDGVVPHFRQLLVRADANVRDAVWPDEERRRSAKPYAAAPSDDAERTRVS